MDFSRAVTLGSRKDSKPRTLISNEKKMFSPNCQPQAMGGGQLAAEVGAPGGGRSKEDRSTANEQEGT